jgi:hypothetical protein
LEQDLAFCKPNVQFNWERFYTNKEWISKIISIIEKQV